VTGDPAQFSVKLWGTRGSTPVSARDTVIYGGNTSCLEVTCGSERLLFDAGTGLQAFARAHPHDETTEEFDLFLSHTHLDHVCGLSYFAMHRPRGSVCRLWAGHMANEEAVQRVLETLMGPPIFPLRLKDMRVRFDIRMFRAGETLEPKPGIDLRTAPLRHPDRATGYRATFDGRSIAYVTDTEHVPGKLDATILELIQGADLFIYDCTFSDERFAPKIGWGHSTWQEGVRLADAAGVKTLVVFHHDPEADDVAMDAVARAVADARPGSVVARDGMILTP
jgi:phosphoribosyl 1,2-cyclic phosphodiesterase